jgi:hypothetical protein
MATEAVARYGGLKGSAVLPGRLNYHYFLGYLSKTNTPTEVL